MKKNIMILRVFDRISKSARSIGRQPIWVNPSRIHQFVNAAISPTKKCQLNVPSVQMKFSIVERDSPSISNS